MPSHDPQFSDAIKPTDPRGFCDRWDTGKRALSADHARCPDLAKGLQGMEREDQGERCVDGEDST